MKNNKLSVLTGQFSLVLAFFLGILNFLYLNNNIPIYILCALLFGLSLVYNLRYLLLISKGKTL